MFIMLQSPTLLRRPSQIQLIQPLLQILHLLLQLQLVLLLKVTEPQLLIRPLIWQQKLEMASYKNAAIKSFKFKFKNLFLYLLPIFIKLQSPTPLPTPPPIHLIQAMLPVLHLLLQLHLVLLLKVTGQKLLIQPLTWQQNLGMASFHYQTINSSKSRFQ